MQRFLAMLLVPAILLTQVVVGMSPGRSLCIVLEACCGERGHHGHHGHHDHADHHRDRSTDAIAASHRGAHGIEHRHLHLACSDHASGHHASGHYESGHHESGCDGSDSHFHLIVPDDAGTLRSGCDPQLVLVDVAALDLPEAMVVDLAPSRAAAFAGEPPPWVWPSCDQRRAIETDRLLI